MLALASIAFAVAGVECGLRVRDYGSIARLSAEHVLSALWEEAWLVTRRMILETRRLARSAGAEFAILYVPTIVQVDPEHRRRAEHEFPGLPFDHTRINRALARFCAEHRIPLLDPLDAFVAANRERLVFYQIEDHHWNAEGHAVAARERARFLDREGLIPSSPQRAACDARLRCRLNSTAR